MWLEKIHLRKLNNINDQTYLLSATAKYCFCNGWTLTHRSVLGSSEWRDSCEFLQKKFKNQRFIFVTCSSLIDYKLIDNNMLPRCAPIDDGNFSVPVPDH